MPRKGPVPKRPLVDDPVYGSKLVSQLVNRVLLDGKPVAGADVEVECYNKGKAHSIWRIWPVTATNAFTKQTNQNFNIEPP